MRRQRDQYQFIVLTGVLLAAHAVYWFIGGGNREATGARTAAVAVQLCVGLGIVWWAWLGGRRGAKAGRAERRRG